MSVGAEAMEPKVGKPVEVGGNPSVAPALQEYRLPKVDGLEETESSVSYLGVEVQKGKGGPLVPSLSRFENDVLTPFDLKLMQKVAVALEMNEPILIEGGSGIGKTRGVERLCAQTNKQCFYANCHDFEIDILIGAKTSVSLEESPTGFGWRDGVVMKAIREGGVLILDEYNFMRDETRGRMHEVLDAVLSGKERISLVENDSEVVEVHPDFRIIALTNEPGGEYEGRDTLDKAQYTRFINMSEPNDLPEEVKLARTLGSIGVENDWSIDSADYIHSGEALIQKDLRNIPNMENLLRQFIEFHKTVEGLVKERALAEDQAQPIFFAYQRDLNRFLKFFCNFYRGDIRETAQSGLEYLYRGRFRSETDRAQIDELIRHMGIFSDEDPNRIPLN